MSKFYVGCLRLVRSLKVKVSFAEYRLFFRSLLQKRPVTLRSLLLAATPYVMCQVFFEMEPYFRGGEMSSRMWMRHVPMYEGRYQGACMRRAYTRRACMLAEHLLYCFCIAVEWGVSHVTGGRESCHACGWVVSSFWMRSWSWVMSHIWRSHVTHVNESYYTYEWVMSHMCTHVNALLVLSHIWMSHVPHMNESCHRCEWVMTHMWMRY